MLQALIGLAVLIAFNRFTIALGIASLVIVAVYPFMKRITYWPQIVLGLAFSWGALMGWAAAFGSLARAAASALRRLDLLGDRLRHDLRPSGSRGRCAHRHQIDRFAVSANEPSRCWLLFYALAVVLLGAAGFSAGGGIVFALGLCAFAAHLVWQIVRLDIADPDNCLAVFKSDRDAGLILFAGLLLDAALRRIA